MRTLLRRQDPVVADTARLRAVCGDVGLPTLGLGERTYRGLAASVDEVYHCGASVHLAAAYERLAPVNVEGTGRVIEFCHAAGDARLHYVSTLAVFLKARRVGWESVPEEELLIPRCLAMLSARFGWPPAVSFSTECTSLPER